MQAREEVYSLALDAARQETRLRARLGMLAPTSTIVISSTNRFVKRLRW